MVAPELVKEMIEAGIHYGHRASRWNPKMKPYIYGKRNLIHIINIKETLRGLLLAKKFITRVVAEGKDIVIVGTKRQARKSVQERADAVSMHWVIDRWLGVSPWGLIVFLLLGFAAGVLNVMRSAGLIAGPALDEGTRQGPDK